jgi:hypothetical protein
VVSRRVQIGSPGTATRVPSMAGGQRTDNLRRPAEPISNTF